ncbi:MAG: tetratricopeptide repeat protein, partial [Limisphaerales bacterium]
RVRDERGNLVFLKDDQGNAVKSRLNETLLNEIASRGNGFYIPLVGTTAMETLYNKGLASLPRSESTTRLSRQYRERYKWPLGFAMLLLVFEMFLPQRNRARKEEQIQESSGLKKATVATLILFLPLLSFASPARAKKEYDAGRYAEAFAEYQKLLEKRTNDFRLHFNAGDAAYQAHEFDIARKHFETATIAPNLDLQQKAYYNLGNTLYQIGEPLPDPKQKQQTWEQAIKSYQNALQLNPQDPDSQHNLQFVQQRLEELKQEQQEQSQPDKNQDQGEQDQQEQQQNSPDKNQEQEDQQQRNQDSAQQEQQQQQQQQDQRDRNQPQNQSGQSENRGDEQENDSSEAEMSSMDGQMTEEQAQQFLDALKREEKPLIFTPPPKERKNPNLPFKDW